MTLNRGGEIKNVEERIRRVKSAVLSKPRNIGLLENTNVASKFEIKSIQLVLSSGSHV